MKFFAFAGHPTQGHIILRILEDMGGINLAELACDDPSLAYFIYEGIIICSSIYDEYLDVIELENFEFDLNEFWKFLEFSYTSSKNQC